MNSLITIFRSYLRNNQLSETGLVSVIVIILVSLSVYFNTLSNQFVYDDSIQVLQNPWIKDIKHIPAIFSNDVWAFQEEVSKSNYYRPLMHIMYMLIYHVVGMNAWAFHLVNILFHAGISVLVYLFTVKLLRKTSLTDRPVPVRSAFVAAVLFATHPIHTEAVAWVAGMPELSFTLFFLLSLYWYMAADDRYNRYYVLSVLSFFSAALCKETALTLPLMLIVYDSVYRKSATATIRFVRYLPYVLVSCVYLWLRLNALDSLAPEKRHTYLSAYQYVINIFPLFARYLEKLVFPLDLNAFHVFHPVKSLLETGGTVSLIITLLFMILAIAARKNKTALFGLAFIVVPLLPVLYIPGLGENTFAERYLYLPSYGFVMLLAYVCVSLAVRYDAFRIIVILTLVTVTSLYATGSIMRNSVWKNEYSLFQDTVNKSPDGLIPRQALAGALLERGEIDKAIEQCEIAVNLAPTARSFLNLGVAYLSKGMVDKAIVYTQIALTLWQNYDEAHYRLGNAYELKGWIDMAMKEYQTAIVLNPGLVDAYHCLGDVYLKKGRTDNAIENYLTALKLLPSNSGEIHAKLGNAYRLQGAAAAGMQHLRMAAALDPDNAEIHLSLGYVYLEIGMADEARKEFARAMEISPGNQPAVP